MTQPKGVSIKIGNVTLSTANIPKEGIDLTKLSEDAKKSLSIFDTNDDGKLSRTEINNAILKFARADKTHTEQDENDPDKSITTRKNGKLEDVELKGLYKRKQPLSELEELAALHEAEQAYKSAMLGVAYGGNSEELAKLTEEAKGLVEKSQSKRTISSYELKNAAKELQKELVRANMIQKKGFEETHNDNWVKDSSGNHYKYNYDTLNFEKVDNVDFVSKDGSYRTRIKNQKGQQILTTYDQESLPTTIKALNYKNGVYIKPNYVAKIAGLELLDPNMDIYLDQNEVKYYWDNDTHSFVRP